MNVFSKLKNTVSEKGACFIVLLDPDSKNNNGQMILNSEVEYPETTALTTAGQRIL